MPGFRVTPRAQDDLRNIGRYTEKQWGRRQRNIYLKAIEKRFAWLAENPRLGKHRTDVTEGYYSFPQGQHVIFYLISESGIDDFVNRKSGRLNRLRPDRRIFQAYPASSSQP